MITKHQTNLTKEELLKWIARLRDPNSKQCRGAVDYKFGKWDEAKSDYIVADNDASCCLVHGQHAIEGAAYVGSAGDRDYWKWMDRANIRQVSHELIGMNQSKTLPQIADWIDAHLLPIDIL